jgi:hypothetical protein
MPINPSTLAEARALVEKAGMSGFSPTNSAPASTGGIPVALALIDTFERAPGIPLFDKPDPERPGVLRSSSILSALRDGIPIPPILLFQRKGEQRYELRDGYHRLHLCAALGYTHVPAEITNWKPGEY